MRAIDRFSPHNIHPDIWSEIEPLVREVTRLAVPATVYKAQVVAGQATKIANWCWRTGRGIEQHVVFHPETIEEFIESECSHLTPGTQLNYRSQLRHIGEVLLGQPLYGPRARPRRLSERREPYSENDMAALFGIALSCPTERQRHGATALIAAGFGAGLSQSDMALVRGSDVKRLHSVICIEVPGANKRVVPVRDAWADHLVEVAMKAGDRSLVLPHLGNVVTSRQLSRLTEDIKWLDAPKLSIQRMRITWLVALLDAGIRLNVIAEMAGVMAEQVGEYAQFMPQPQLDDYANEVRHV